MDTASEIKCIEKLPLTFLFCHEIFPEKNA